MPHIGPMELIIALVIVIAVFGAGKLANVGGALGKGIREFKQASNGEGEGQPKATHSTNDAAPTPKA